MSVACWTSLPRRASPRALDMDLLYPYGGALLAPFAAAYVASVICRLHLRSRKRPGGFAGSIALVVGILVAWLCSFQFDAFIPSRWSTVDGKVGLGPLLVATGFLAVLTGVFPTAFIVRRYQKSYDHNRPKI